MTNESIERLSRFKGHPVDYVFVAVFLERILALRRHRKRCSFMATYRIPTPKALLANPK